MARYFVVRNEVSDNYYFLQMHGAPNLLVSWCEVINSYLVMVVHAPYTSLLEFGLKHGEHAVRKTWSCDVQKYKNESMSNTLT